MIHAICACRSSAGHTNQTEEKTIVGKKVLLIEPNLRAAKNYSDWLKQAGFTVLVAYTSNQARHLFNREMMDPEGLDLVISTFRLDSTAENLMAELCEQEPDLPLLFLSAFHDDGVVGDHKMAFLKTPVTLQERLLEPVRALTGTP